VDLEEGGEKWRAGDAVKSMRFFMRAIEMYDNGLKRYPTSFDLAYNKYNFSLPFIYWIIAGLYLTRSSEPESNMKSRSIPSWPPSSRPQCWKSSPLR
jgi:hypothetical protein